MTPITPTTLCRDVLDQVEAYARERDIPPASVVRAACKNQFLYDRLPGKAAQLTTDLDNIKAYLRSKTGA